MSTGDTFLVLSAFLASAVEFVEALTVVPGGSNMAAEMQKVADAVAAAGRKAMSDNERRRTMGRRSTASRRRSGWRDPLPRHR